jgi:hypothetical protein
MERTLAGTVSEKCQRPRRQTHSNIPPLGTANRGYECECRSQQRRTQDDLVFVLRPGESVHKTVGPRRVEQREPEQHDQQHSARAEQVGELASHVANIRLGEVTSRDLTGVRKQGSKPGPGIRGVDNFSLTV